MSQPFPRMWVTIKTLYMINTDHSMTGRNTYLCIRIQFSFHGTFSCIIFDSDRQSCNGKTFNMFGIKTYAIGTEAHQTNFRIYTFHRNILLIFFRYQYFSMGKTLVNYFNPKAKQYSQQSKHLASSTKTVSSVSHDADGIIFLTVTENQQHILCDGYGKLLNSGAAENFSCMCFKKNNKFKSM